MNKLRLVLADEDSRYVDVVTQYINVEYPLQLQVVAFTQPHLLTEYLSGGQGQVDVLLAQPIFVMDLQESQVPLPFTLLLDDGALEPQRVLAEHKELSEQQELKVDKYQPGDQLVNCILELHTQHIGTAPRRSMDNSAARVLSVYSPVGGVGKSSVALALASKLSEMGKQVFYLNLEIIDSFGGTSGLSGNNAMSQVLLTLLETPDLLPLKMEMYKTADSYFGFDFLTPPDCYRELSEITAQHWQTLLDTLRTLGKYDFILVDLNSAGDERTNQVLDLADGIILVQTPEPLCRYKFNTFLRQNQALTGTDFISKTTILLNKYANESIPQELPAELSFQFLLPAVANLWVTDNQQLRFDSQGILKDSLTPLAETLLVKG